MKVHCGVFRSYKGAWRLGDNRPAIGNQQIGNWELNKAAGRQHS